METLTATTTVSSDGLITLQVPAAFKGAKVEYVLTLEKKADKSKETDEPVDQFGWPIGFFERYAGCITDPDFKRYPQGEPDPVPPFE